MYICALLGATALAPCLYQTVLWLAQQVDWAWVAYLSHKPINQYIDRLRLILFSLIVLVCMTRWQLWHRLGLNKGLKLYLKTFTGGCLLWLGLFGIIAITAKPVFGYHNVWAAAFLASFCVAFLEELIFRGFTLDVLRQRHSLWLSTLILTLIFACMHFSLCRNIPANDSLWSQSFKCAYYSIVDIPQNIHWTYFWCLCTLNYLLVYLRLSTGTLWSCIGFHQGLVFTLMVLRKNFWFHGTASAWWGIGCLTDSWFVVAVLAVSCSIVFYLQVKAPNRE